ncbi:substrate-binding domain-containing protein [Rhodococcus triatomae]|uniref:substrate-binding domain-containing protein n=1 Tax=Rhodococcus triatomae TaxID=300028 RepID=UPI001FE9262B|nr:substrate-binding domain-containing protein [Rhodococcus triatomae]
MSTGLVVAVLACAVVAAAVFGWLQLRDRIQDQGTAAAEACVEGESILHVAADPAIAPRLAEIAREFSATTPVIRDRCVTAEVTPVASDSARDALTTESGWNDDLGPRPALWVPSSTHDARRVAPTAVANGEPRSLATSPIVLAAPTVLAEAMTEAGTGWRDLPWMQNDPAALAPWGLPEWGSLGLALPMGPESPGTEMALEAVAAAVADEGAGPVTEEVAQSDPVRSAIVALGSGYQAAGGQPEATAPALLESLAGDPDPADAAVHAVPTTEQSILTLLRDRPDAGIAAVAPAGATPVADYPAVTLRGPGTDDTTSRAAAQFVDFALDPQRAQVFTDHGFRVGGAEGPEGVGPRPLPPIGTPLVPADAATATELTAAARDPLGERNTVVILDVSQTMGTDNDGRSRLEAASSALAAHVERSPGSSNLGLWTAGSGADGAVGYRIAVPLGPVSEEGLPGGTRSESLVASLGDQSASGRPTPYAALSEAYERAAAGYVPGRPNSILLVTDGTTDTSPGIDRAALLSAISDSADSSRPVTVDVLVLGGSGPSPDTATLQTVADRTGGSLVRVDSADDAAVAAAVNRMLS